MKAPQDSMSLPPYTYPHGPTGVISTSDTHGAKVDFHGVLAKTDAEYNAGRKEPEQTGSTNAPGGDGRTPYHAGRKA